MCGSATHPGGGIMGAPGRIAALEYLKAKREGAEGRLMADEAIDAIVIGAGHNGLVAAAYLPRRAGRSWCSSALSASGGILRGQPSPRPGSARRAWSTRSGACAPSVVKDLEVSTASATRPIAPAVRMHAPMPDGSAITFWGDARARTARSCEPAARTTPMRTSAFDQKVRAIASFLAYVQVATAARPEVAVARRRDHGPEARQGVPRPGREDRPRGDPGAADGRGRSGAGGLRGRGGARGRSRTRGVLYTAMGAWATGTAQVFLSDSAGTDGGAAGTAVFARGGTGRARRALGAGRAGASASEIRTGAEVVADPDASGNRAIGVTLADGSELDAR